MRQSTNMFRRISIVIGLFTIAHMSLDSDEMEQPSSDGEIFLDRIES